MEQTINDAIQNHDYAALQSIFFEESIQSWKSSSEGERKTIAAYFITNSVLSSTYFPAAFQSSVVVDVIKIILNHLPSPVEGALDNKLRTLLFEYLLSKEDYQEAATVLLGLRMEDVDEESVYYMQPFKRVDVFVKIAECYVADKDSSRAEGAVQKAGGIIDSILNPEQNVSLITRYKSIYADVLDANLKFLQAAGRYLELSHVSSFGNMVDTVDLLHMLGKASTCVILSPINAQRERMLGKIFGDERLFHLDNIGCFKYHIPILKSMYLKRIIERDDGLINFENSLSDHHKTTMVDGLTIVQRAIVEHNIVAMSELYSSVFFSHLERFIDISPKHAEEIIAEMITNGRVYGSIDQIDCILYFQKNQSGLIEWDETIVGFCSRLNDIVNNIKQE